MHRLSRVAVIWLGLSSAFSATVIPSLGADFYTRKRINGRWVEGYFPKESARARPNRDAQSAVPATQGPEPTVTTATEPPPTLGLHFSAPNQQEPGQASREGVEDPQLPTSEVVTTGSTRVRQPTRVSRSV